LPSKNAEEDYDDFPEPPPLPTAMSSNSLDPISPSPSPLSNATLNNSLSSISRKRPRASSPPSRLESTLTDYVSALISQKKEDDDTTFLMSLLPLLRKVPEDRKDEAKLRLHTCLYDLLSNRYTVPSSTLPGYYYQSPPI
jgi:hypothetical protein